MSDELNFARHVSERLGYGPRPGDLARIAEMGADRWIERQLQPSGLPLPAELSRSLDRLATLRMSPSEVFLAYGPPSYRLADGSKPTAEEVKAAIERGRIVPTEAIEARLLRALESPRQLEERLVEFWFNHFNVFVGKGLDRLWVGLYEQEAIRPHVLGKFRDLLGATAKHPAMLFYLDNWENTAPNSTGARGNSMGLNENYARELMELHTLGVDGGYTQSDVIALARILTGWGFAGNRNNGEGRPQRPGLVRRMLGNGALLRAAVHRARAFRFDPDRHDTADKHLLGRTIKGRGGESGIQEGEEALDMLARAPATARHISFKLAEFFVADAPDDALVGEMTATFLATDGDIRAVMRTMVAQPAFRAVDAAGTRFKTPYQFVLSAVRASGLAVRNIKPLYGTLALLGQPLYGRETPDGYKCTTEAWLNADAMTRRISFAVGLGAGKLPLDADPDPRGLKVRKPDRVSESQLKENAIPLDAAALIATVGPRFSAKTLQVVESAAVPLKAGLVLGSPEFMRC